MPANGKRAMRQRPDRALAQGRRDLAQQRAREIGPLDRQLVDIDREIGNILPQRPQMDAAVQVEVALAEFEKAAERLQHAEALLHRLAAQRIQHDIDAAAAGDRAHRVGKAEIARIEDMIGAGQAQKGPLHLRPGRRDDGRAAQLRVLDRGQADPAGGGVDQHEFARFAASPECRAHRSR